MNDTDDDDDDSNQIWSNNYTIAESNWNELSECLSGEIESTRAIVVSPVDRLEVIFECAQLAIYILNVWSTAFKFISRLNRFQCLDEVARALQRHKSNMDERSARQYLRIVRKMVI